MPFRLYMNIEELIETDLPYKAELFLNDRGDYGVKVRMVTFGQDEDSRADTVIDLDNIDF